MIRWNLRDEIARIIANAQGCEEQYVDWAIPIADRFVAFLERCAADEPTLQRTGGNNAL
jgi:hypothetical protein